MSFYFSNSKCFVCIRCISILSCCCCCFFFQLLMHFAWINQLLQFSKKPKKNPHHCFCTIKIHSTNIIQLTISPTTTTKRIGFAITIWTNWFTQLIYTKCNIPVVVASISHIANFARNNSIAPLSKAIIVIQYILTIFVCVHIAVTSQWNQFVWHFKSKYTSVYRM